MMRLDHAQAIRRSGVLKLLTDFDPHVAGTTPLGLAVTGSDIDILCCAPNVDRFCATVWNAFSGAATFSMRQWTSKDCAVVASFNAHDWTFELFASQRPVRDQAGWRHYEVERRLLLLGGSTLRTRVMELRTLGMKTEPAFAKILGLDDDPYQSLLDMFECDDASLLGFLS